MRYQLAPISTRPWLLNGLWLRLIESHYEDHYGGAQRGHRAEATRLRRALCPRWPGRVAQC